MSRTDGERDILDGTLDHGYVRERLLDANVYEGGKDKNKNIG